MNMREKIKKILDKAASTDSEGEASVLIEKAERLMQEHQIDAADLEDASDPVDMSVGVSGQSGPVAYKTHLQRALATYYGCKNIRVWEENRKWHLELVGPLSARVTTELMTDYVWKQTNREAARVAAEEGVKKGPMQRRIVNALVSRIHQLVADRKAAERPEVTTKAAKNALILKNQTVAKFEELYPHATTARGSSRSTNNAAREAAAGISLARQTSGTTVKRLS